MNYTIILQNILTKNTYKQNVSDSNSNKIYYLFEINTTNLEDGYYNLILVPNDNLLDIIINNNDIYNSKFENGENITIIYKDIMKVGEYENDSIFYNKNVNFLEYEN